jgi:hypothetical protein
VFGILKRRRRRRLRATPLPASARTIIERRVPYSRCLPAPLRAELEGLVQVFLAEKRFDGCAGLEISDEMRLTIAAQACVLLLGRETDVYPMLHSILVYPGAYVSHEPVLEEGGLVSEGPDERIGESWIQGSLVLSWDDVESAGADDGVNVVYHEFAHQLDDEAGGAEGTPQLPESDMYADWQRVMTSEYEQLVEAADGRRPTVLDEYGTESPAEFFAVATECFFERSVEMRARHPELYGELARLYRQDPADWAQDLRPVRRRRRHPLR